MCKFKINDKFKTDKIIYSKPQFRKTYYAAKNKPSIFTSSDTTICIVPVFFITIH